MPKRSSNMTIKISHIAAKFGQLSSNTFGVSSFNCLNHWSKWRHQTQSSNGCISTTSNKFKKIPMSFFIAHKLHFKSKLIQKHSVFHRATSLASKFVKQSIVTRFRMIDHFGWLLPSRHYKFPRCKLRSVFKIVINYIS